MSKAFIDKKIEIIMTYFDKDAISMPEYQPEMRGLDTIKEYYTEILNRRKVKIYNKIVSELIALNNNIVETGTFTTTYNSNDDQLITLNGKYLNIWAIQKNGALKLKAESYGYFQNMDDAKSHVVKISKELIENKDYIKTQKDKNLAFQLKALNVLNAEAVRKRNGNECADFFTEDGIFMPFADSTKTGMNAIRNHMIKYNQGGVTFDSIEVYNNYFEDCGQYVIEYSKFYVKWHVPNLSRIVTGKGIRIWRREPDCTLKRFIEIGTHDYIE